MRHFVLAPRPDRRVGFCRASYRTKFGVVKSEWRYSPDGGLEWKFTIPSGTRAKVTPPGGKAEMLGPGDHVRRIPAARR